MKKITMFVLLLTVMVFSLNAEIFRVNDTPTAYAPYATIGEAITVAVAGDTILVEGGDYSGFSVDKCLTILGPGNIMLTGANWNNSRAKITNSVSLTSGSEGTIISGFYFYYQGYSSGTLSISANNITIENSSFYYHYKISVNTATDIDIKRCWDLKLYLGTSSNVNCYNSKLIELQNNGSELFLFNNIITCGEVSVQNTYAYNNIFTSTIFSIESSTNIDNIFQYNVCAGDFLSPYLNNILDVNMAAQFTQGPNDTYYELTNDSVAIGAGMNGEDCGMFGGVTPYKPDGIPWQIPTIIEFEVTESANSINVQIGAKNNPSPTNPAPRSRSRRD